MLPSTSTSVGHEPKTIAINLTHSVVRFSHLMRTISAERQAYIESSHTNEVLNAVLIHLQDCKSSPSTLRFQLRHRTVRSV